MNTENKNKTNTKKIKFVLPSRNRYASRKEWENACWHAVLKSEKFLDILLTFHERHKVVMRAVAVTMIHSGKKFQQIVEELRLSPQTVSGIKKAINENAYKSYRERGKTERKKRVYGSKIVSRAVEKKPEGRPVRTKYGVIYL